MRSSICALLAGFSLLAVACGGSGDDASSSSSAVTGTTTNGTANANGQNGQDAPNEEPSPPKIYKRNTAIDVQTGRESAQPYDATPPGMIRIGRTLSILTKVPATDPPLPPGAMVFGLGLASGVGDENQNVEIDEVIATKSGDDTWTAKVGLANDPNGVLDSIAVAADGAAETCTITLRQVSDKTFDVKVGGEAGCVRVKGQPLVSEEGTPVVVGGEPVTFSVVGTYEFLPRDPS